jgi:hypothetical protein
VKVQPVFFENHAAAADELDETGRGGVSPMLAFFRAVDGIEPENKGTAYIFPAPPLAVYSSVG